MRDPNDLWPAVLVSFAALLSLCAGLLPRASCCDQVTALRDRIRALRSCVTTEP